MSQPDIERVRRPEIVLGEMLRSYAKGDIGSGIDRVLYRAVVLAVDDVGGMLSGPTSSTSTVDGVGVDGRKRSYSRMPGPLNPRGSVKALVIDGALDSFSDEDSARILWPFFPTDQMALPVSPGEHVYSLFEDINMEHGLWVCRVSGHDGPNVSPGSDFFLSSDGSRRLEHLFDHSIERKSPAKATDDVSTRVKPTKKRLADLF